MQQAWPQWLAVSSAEKFPGVPSVVNGLFGLVLFVRPAYGVGAGKEATRDVVLPSALPGLTAGTILALARAIGETAPPNLVGTAVSIFGPPTSLFDPFAAMPLQICEWAGHRGGEFNTGAGSVVLVTVLLLMNGAGTTIRNEYQIEL